jgi:hypothetical protein
LRRLAFLGSRLALIVLALIVWSTDSARVDAALSFTSTDVVNFGKSASVNDCFNNDGTMAFWMFPTATTAAGTFARKDTGTAILSFTSTGIQLSLARATQSLNASVNTANIPAFGTNKWVFVAAEWDTAGANGDQAWFGGDLTTTVAAVSSYTVQRVGSGAVTNNDALNLLVGNTSTANAAFPGNIAIVQLWNRRLAIGELKDQQFYPHNTSGCVILSPLGFNGTSTQPDWCGNGNAGTVTGSAVVAHVPIGRLFF